MTDENRDERSAAEGWLKKLTAAEKAYAKYYDLVDETRDFYKDSKGSRSGKYNIFWSTVETLKPFLYFKQPKPYIDRINKSADKAEMLACRILERALVRNLESFDFDAKAKYARNDFLISGCGGGNDDNITTGGETITPSASAVIYGAEDLHIPLSATIERR